MRVIESQLYERLLKLLNESATTAARENVSAVLENVVQPSQQEVTEHVEEKPEAISKGTQTEINTGDESVWRSFDKLVSDQTGERLKIGLKKVKSKPVKKSFRRKPKKCVGKRKKKCRRKC